MGIYSRPDGTTYFATLPSIDPDVGAQLDQEINGIVSTVNALDNANIASTPKIAGSKVDLTSAGFLALTGGSLSGLLTHNFDGIFRLMRASGNGRIREYRGSDGAIWGISYNTSWNGSSWDGRDITDVCLAIKLESSGLRLYNAVSGGAGTTPSWTNYCTIGTSGTLTLNGAITSESVYESSVSWANAGGISQTALSSTEYSKTGDTNWTLKDSISLYIPANANSFEYVAWLKVSANTGNFRLVKGATNGTTVSTTSTSYVQSSAGTIDVSALSGWQSIDIYLQIMAGGDTAYAKNIFGRFI